MNFLNALPTVGPQALANSHAYPSKKHVPEQEEKNLQRPYVVLGFSEARVIDLAKDIVRIVQHVLKSYRVVIVCLAKSDSTGVEGVTDPKETMTSLPSAARESVNHEFRSYVAIVEAIRIDHIESAKPLLRNPAVQADYIKLVNAECDRLMEILKSLPHLDGVSNPLDDKTFSKGTNLSCIFMAALLQDRGVDAQYVDIGDAISRDLHPALRQEIVSCDKMVPVMTSFFEDIPGGPNKAIGKSPIDLCAASVAARVGAQELQIWAEVDGFFTVDPRRVPGARLIPSVTPSEAVQLLSHSSKDIQAFAIEQAIRERIPVCIKNVLNPHGSGTMISLDDVTDTPSCIGTSSTLTAGCKDSVQKKSNFAFASISHSKRPTAITIKDRIMVLNVHSNKLASAHGFLMNLFRVLDKWNLSVDLVSSSEVLVSMAINLDARPLSTDEQLQYAVEELNEYGNVNLVPDMTIVSLIGHQLKNIVGISGAFFSVLGANDINIEMISQGASETAICCVINKRDANRALNILHGKFFSHLE